MATSALNICSLRAGSMGSMRAWLPSRRSTEHQIGAFQISRLGHSRSARRVGRGRKGTYFSTGIFLGLAGTGGILGVLLRLYRAGLRFAGETKTSCAVAGGRRRAPKRGSPQIRRRLVSKRFLVMVAVV